VRIRDHRRAAVAARLAQMMQSLQLAALALPVADRVLDELERRVLAEVADGKHRFEHRLQTRVLALARQTVHLQEAFVGLLLDLDQVRDRNGRLDFRKVDALAVDVLGQAVHSLDLEEKTRALSPTQRFWIVDCGLWIWIADELPILESTINPQSPIRNPNFQIQTT